MRVTNTQEKHMADKVVQNIANSKSLVDALIKTCDEQLDDEKSYVLKLGFALQPQKLEDINKIKTFLNKFRTALAEFNDDVLLSDLVLAVHLDTSEFDRALIQRTHEILRSKVEVVTDEPKETPEPPEAA
jgi:hypothetical protein